jgi:hypothetical protein
MILHFNQASTSAPQAPATTGIVSVKFGQEVSMINDSCIGKKSEECKGVLK